MWADTVRGLRAVRWMLVEGRKGRAPAAASQGGAPDTAEAVAAVRLQRPAPVHHCDSQALSQLISMEAPTAAWRMLLSLRQDQLTGAKAFPPRCPLDHTSIRTRSVSSLLGAGLEWFHTQNLQTWKSESNMIIEFEIEMK